jgi:hypothetical protein
MRRALVTTLAVPALLFSACSSDDGPSVEESSNDQADQAQESTQESTQEPADAEETTEEPAEAQASTQEPADTEESTAAGPAEGGAAGKAAAARTKEFMVALVNADPEICQLILDFQGEGPMKDSPEDLQICEEVLPSTLEGLVGEEEAAIIDVIEVNGADVDGDTAIVDSDNFSELFAEGFGDEEITLKRFQKQWYVDLDNSFQGTS